jgi:hypothetical protein
VRMIVLVTGVAMSSSLWIALSMPMGGIGLQYPGLPGYQGLPMGGMGPGGMGMMGPAVTGSSSAHQALRFQASAGAARAGCQVIGRRSAGPQRGLRNHASRPPVRTFESRICDPPEARPVALSNRCQHRLSQPRSAGPQRGLRNRPSAIPASRTLCAGFTSAASNIFATTASATRFFQAVGDRFGAYAAEPSS